MFEKLSKGSKSKKLGAHLLGQGFFNFLSCAPLFCDKLLFFRTKSNFFSLSHDFETNVKTFFLFCFWTLINLDHWFLKFFSLCLDDYGAMASHSPSKLPPSPV